MPDNAPASVHATVEVRRTQTPESLAESAFSAIARIASPHGDQRTNAAIPMATIGAATSDTTSPGGNLKPSSVNEVLIGTGKGSKSFFGLMKGRTVSRYRTCDRPMVATITIIRGRLNSLRSNSSDPAPAAAARMRGVTSAAQ